MVVWVIAGAALLGIALMHARRFEYGWLRAAGSAAFALATLVSGWQASAAGLATPMSISGALLALGGMVALLLPSLPQDRTLTGSSRLRTAGQCNQLKSWKSRCGRFPTYSKASRSVKWCSWRMQLL
jgi:hypothetical protein